MTGLVNAAYGAKRDHFESMSWVIPSSGGVGLSCGIMCSTETRRRGQGDVEVGWLVQNHSLHRDELGGGARGVEFRSRVT